MTENELKKLSRKELLEIMIKQGKELQVLQEKYASAKAALDDRQIKIENAGSIAEASLQLSGVFEAAQEACAQYMENLSILSQNQEAICARRDKESRQKAAKLIEEAKRESAMLREETEAQCKEMRLKAQKESQAYWDEVHTRLQAFSAEHAELQTLLSVVGTKDKGTRV